MQADNKGKRKFGLKYVLDVHTREKFNDNIEQLLKNFKILPEEEITRTRRRIGI
jgi:hypothetical protein